MSDPMSEQLRAQGEAQQKAIEGQQKIIESQGKVNEAAAKNQPMIVNSGNMGDVTNVGRDEANVGDNAHQNTDNKN